MGMVYAFSGRKALRYEHYSQAGVKTNRHLSETLIALIGIESNTYILEFLAGTGITTKMITEIQPRVKNITAVEKDSDMLEVARYKFHQHPSLEEFEQKLKEDPYSGIAEKSERLGMYIHKRDLVGRLREEKEETKEFKDRVKFIESDVVNFLEFLEEEGLFDVVLMSNGFHWVYKHEKRDVILRNLNDVIKKGGMLGFNTTGSDFDYESAKVDFNYLNDVHRNRSHPLYYEVRKNLRNNGFDIPEKLGYTFTFKDIDDELTRHGFRMVRRKYELIEYPPHQFVENLLMANYHFLGLSIENVEEVEKKFVEAIESALTTEEKSLLTVPIYETGAHFVYEKIGGS